MRLFLLLVNVVFQRIKFVMIQSIVDNCLCWVSFADLLWPVRTLSEMTKEMLYTLKCCFLVAEGLFSNHILSGEPQWSVLAQAWSANLMAFCASDTAKVYLWNHRGCVCGYMSLRVCVDTLCDWLLSTPLHWPVRLTPASQCALQMIRAPSSREIEAHHGSSFVSLPSPPWHMSPFHACQTLTCPVHASHIRWVDLLQVASWTVSL